MPKIVKESWLTFCDIPDSKEEIEILIQEAIEFQKQLDSKVKSRLQNDYHNYRSELMRKDEAFQPFYIWLRENKEKYM